MNGREMKGETLLGTETGLEVNTLSLALLENRSHDLYWGEGRRGEGEGWRRIWVEKSQAISSKY